MPGDVTQFIDYTTNTNSDTGENTAASIQPLLDGQSLNGTNIGRGGESLRQRTEAVRNVFEDTLYLRDADRNLIIAGPGLVSWPGSTTVAASGLLSLSDVLWLLPMLTPGFAQASPVPPVASDFGTLSLERASDSMASILVTSMRRSYAAGDQISIDVSSGASFSVTLDAVTGYQRTIHIVSTGSDTLGTVISALNALTPGAPDNTQLVSAVLEGGALTSDLLKVPQAKQFVSGNYDGEGHTITPANLAAFFSANPTSALAEGDTLCVWFPMVSDISSTGGRRQALPENSNTTVPVGSFFNSRIHPDRLVNALPICKVVNGYLVFNTGASVPAGSVAVGLNTAAAASISYAGGPAWADGTTNPATTVQAQLSKIVSDLAGSAGTGKVQGSTVSSWLPVGTLAAQLTKIEQLARNPRPLADSDVVPLVTYRDFGARPRSLVDHNGYRMGQVSEIDETWATLRPRTLKVSPSGMVLASGTPGAWDGVEYAFNASSIASYDIALPTIPDGAFITNVTIWGLGGDSTSLFTGALRLIDATGTVTTFVANHRTGSGNFGLVLGTSPSAGSLPQLYNAATQSLTLTTTLTGTITGTTALWQIEVDYVAMPLDWEIQTSTAGGGNNGVVTVALATDTNLRQRSIALATSTTAAIGRWVLARPHTFNETFDDNTTYVTEFMLRTGTVDDSSHGCVMRAMLCDDIIGTQAFGIYWDHSFANWQFQIESAMDVGLADSVTNIADTGVAVAANTNYRVRLEYEGANVASLPSGHAELRCYINGTLVGTFASIAWTNLSMRPHFIIDSNAAGGPYNMFVGRVRRVWNHLLSNDVL